MRHSIRGCAASCPRCAEPRRRSGPRLPAQAPAPGGARRARPEPEDHQGRPDQPGHAHRPAGGRTLGHRRQRAAGGCVIDRDPGTRGRHAPAGKRAPPDPAQDRKVPGLIHPQQHRAGGARSVEHPRRHEHTGRWPWRPRVGPDPEDHQERARQQEGERHSRVGPTDVRWPHHGPTVAAAINGPSRSPGSAAGQGVALGRSRPARRLRLPARPGPGPGAGGSAVAR